jgi:long-chain acyl-CoA synthetase
MTVSAEDKRRLLDRYDQWASLPAMALEMLQAGDDRPFLWAKASPTEDYSSISFMEVRQQILALAHGLIAQGLQPGDRVLLVSENRPEWLIADVAIMTAGGISTPAYTTSSVADHNHVLNDSGARAVIVSGGKIAAEALVAAKAVEVEFTISLDDGAGADHSLSELLLAHSDKIEPPETLAALGRNDLSSLIYTSGTGGAPKGVMLSHRAILANCKSAMDLVFDLKEVDDPITEAFLSFLPLSHAYERTAGQFFPLSAGCQIYYAEGIDKLPKNLTEACPTIMTAVPRLYETMYARILHGLRNESDLKQRMFHRAVALGKKRIETGSLGLLERVEDATLEALVRSKVQARFGGRLKVLISGGAPLNYDVGMFFAALGLRLLQGYGQTEAAPVVACNRPHSLDLSTVGPKLLGVEIKLADDGEILVAGDLLMDGYWGRPDETAETIKDGWLYTGDVGVFDDQNRLKITDRKKDLIVNAGGDNISPQRVEGVLTLEAEIENALVYGDRRPNLVALIVPDPDFAKDWAANHDLKAEDLAEDQGFRAAISTAVDRANEKLSSFERIRRFAISPESFTTDNGLLTQTLKIRRKFIVEAYKDRLDALYGGK